MAEQQSSFPATWALVQTAGSQGTWQVRGESGVPLGAPEGTVARRTAVVTISVTADPPGADGTDTHPGPDEVVAREVLRALLRRSVELYG